MKWTVGAKITAGFAVALAILVTIGVVAFSSTQTLTQTASQVTHTHRVINTLAGVLQGLTDAETGQRGFIITGDEAYLQPYTLGIDQANQNLELLETLTNDNPRQQRRAEALKLQIRDRLARLKEGVTVQREQGSQASHKWVASGVGKKEMDEIRKKIQEMEDEENTLLKERSDAAQAATENNNRTILVGTSLAFVILAILAIAITRNIAGPLGELTTAAQRIASGQLGAKLTLTNRSDEVGVLAQTFDKMSQSLMGMADVAGKIAGGDLRVRVTPQSERDLLGNAFMSMIENLQRLTMQVAEGVNVLAASTGQISTSTAQLAAGASETAVAVTQTTTTVEEVRQTAQVAAQKAKLVSDNAHHVAQATISGQRATQTTLEAMQRIRQQMESIADSMARLSEQTQAIGQIITTVEDLATQSNLLAVNAAIEAAKAGEQGKGFGVVAQEVRSLAEQSKQATNQVRTILNDIQKATSTAVMATEQGTKAVEHGVKQSTEAGEAIHQLSGSVNEAAQAATQIAASSQQQLVGVDQVASAMLNIRQASTQNADSARQLEIAAHNLKDLGQKLDMAIKKYKI
jgi:methyl-accepting chemotaxis protein